MSNLIEVNLFRLLKYLKKTDGETYKNKKQDLLEFINSEIEYKKQKGFLLIEKESKKKNRNAVSRFNALKKYIESHLFLNIKKREDGVLMKQFYYSIAAGLSMIFATIIAFSFQLKYGNFTMPLFVALVVSYMLKDRIKELSRYYFTYKLGSKYFDNKIDIAFNNQPIGWYKEVQTYVKENQLPQEVIQLRNRTSILQAENRINDEKMILYRFMLQLSNKQMRSTNVYPIAGVNNIIRFNLTQFIRKMDNPTVPLFVTDEKEGYKIIDGEKIYYLNFIIRYEYMEQLELKRYRIALNREGIKSLEQF